MIGTSWPRSATTRAARLSLRLVSAEMAEMRVLEIVTVLEAVAQETIHPDMCQPH